jgi:hypothetical protein
MYILEKKGEREKVVFLYTIIYAFKNDQIFKY